MHPVRPQNGPVPPGAAQATAPQKRTGQPLVTLATLPKPVMQMQANVAVPAVRFKQPEQPSAFKHNQPLPLHTYTCRATKQIRRRHARGAADRPGQNSDPAPQLTASSSTARRLLQRLHRRGCMPVWLAYWLTHTVVIAAVTATASDNSTCPGHDLHGAKHSHRIASRPLPAAATEVHTRHVSYTCHIYVIYMSYIRSRRQLMGHTRGAAP